MVDRLYLLFCDKLQISNYFARRGRDAQTYLEIYVTIRNIRIF